MECSTLILKPRRFTVAHRSSENEPRNTRKTVRNFIWPHGKPNRSGKHEIANSCNVGAYRNAARGRERGKTPVLRSFKPILSRRSRGRSTKIEAKSSEYLKIYFLSAYAVRKNRFDESTRRWSRGGLNDRNTEGICAGTSEPNVEETQATFVIGRGTGWRRQSRAIHDRHGQGTGENEGSKETCHVGQA